jgi:hypothetical protein
VTGTSSPLDMSGNYTGGTAPCCPEGFSVAVTS